MKFDRVEAKARWKSSIHRMLSLQANARFYGPTRCTKFGCGTDQIEQCFGNDFPEPAVLPKTVAKVNDRKNNNSFQQ